MTQIVNHYEIRYHKPIVLPFKEIEGTPYIILSWKHIGSLTNYISFDNKKLKYWTCCQKAERDPEFNMGCSLIQTVYDLPKDSEIVDQIMQRKKNPVETYNQILKEGFSGSTAKFKQIINEASR